LFTKGYEIPKAIYLSREPFTLENEILTPTMKLKRNVAQVHFEKEIAQMYEDVKGSSSKL
jgi:long-chain acyl-CoA synthetase